MWVVKYTWDSPEEFQYWQEQTFTSITDAKEFAISLQDDGVAVVKVIKI